MCFVDDNARNGFNGSAQGVSKMRVSGVQNGFVVGTVRAGRDWAIVQQVV